MGIILFLLVFGVIMVFLAGRKGYNPSLWFFAAGIIGLLILYILPIVNEQSGLPESQRESKKKTGDIIGGVMSAIAVILLLIHFTAG